MKNDSKKYDLNGKRVAVLATDGFEQSELMVPVEKLQESGVDVDVISPKGESIRGWTNDDWGQIITADHSLSDANPADYDGLLLPGGVINSDALRGIKDAQKFVRHFLDEGKPTFVICHGAQILIDAELVDGRKMTSYASISKDLINAGADWEDSEVVCENGFVTSRSPEDLPAFCAKMCEELAEGVHVEV
ncbi:MAG: type 1 glutamine amidotransferase [Proteobacteria bacterium]|nr:MAG: type 1 glutamine amidotransferase [Pseudomonadota bacterium]